MEEKELTPQEKRQETYRRNREKRIAQAKKDAERRQADRNRVAAAMRFILNRPAEATPAQLIFCTEVLDHIEAGSNIVPYRASRVLDGEPPDLGAFKRAVETVAEQFDDDEKIPTPTEPAE